MFGFCLLLICFDFNSPMHADGWGGGVSATGGAGGGGGGGGGGR